MPSIEFIPATPAHMPMLKTWAKAAHVREWWPDVEESIAKFLTGEDDGESLPFVALVDGRPVSFVQVWRPTSGADYPWQASLTPDARGFDLFIGDASDLGRGLGTAIVETMARKLLADGASRVVIDPDPANLRAVRCYTKAGFVPVGLVHDCDGESLLMEFNACLTRI